MTKTTLRFSAGLATTCALVASLSGCASEELSIEWCDKHIESGKYSQEELDKCVALYQERAEQEAEKSEADARAKIQNINDNLIVKNFKADYERGAYAITMDIENKNDSDVSGITVTIPYGERYQDNYGDTQIENRELVRDINLIPAKETRPLKIVVSEDYAKRMEAPDEKKITVTTSGDMVSSDQENQSASIADVDVKFGYGKTEWEETNFYFTVTNNTSKKISYVELEGYALTENGNYRNPGNEFIIEPTSISADYLKPGQTSEKIPLDDGYTREMIDLEVTIISFDEE